MFIPIHCKIRPDQTRFKDTDLGEKQHESDSLKSLKSAETSETRGLAHPNVKNESPIGPIFQAAKVSCALQPIVTKPRAKDQIHLDKLQ